MPDNEDSSIYLRCIEDNLLVHTKFYNANAKRLINI